ncbi:uncharacterized protein LOC143266117 [Megachile rotundata]|uniref:uncharacterized protein LOC143266117 n=1 Tax=Megachile rotundata TaxID=143995 RepID=UPI003FCFC498
MTNITETAETNLGYYLPHHAVIKSTSLTTKVRVVFDGSAKTSTGISLNDTLMVGPTIQEDIFSLITRFRSHTYVLTADVEKMYRQIKVHPEDAIFQKILWRKNPKDAIKTYRLDTVTYGTACAPFLAIRALQQLASDNSEQFPVAANAIKNDFYVDDLLTGANTLKEAEILRDQITELLNSGGFNLRQWATNEQSLIEPFKELSSNNCLYLDGDETRRTLGIVWTPRVDTITYKTNIDSDYPITKRNILSRIAQLFDPLGLLGPVIIKAKVIMQQLWKCGIGWDDLVPLTIHSAWITYTKQLPQLNSFSVPREILIREAIDVQIHGFCDASEIAYGACIYLRSSDFQGNTIVRLVAAKSRVAPLKTTSLPRLELCASELLSKLFRATKSALKISFSSCYFWSDSTIALHWIKSPPHTLKTFVANRVAKIQDITESHNWKHVNSLDNPADYISRGQLPVDFLKNHLWLSGPTWLSEDYSRWPISDIPAVDVPERRTVTTLISYPDTSNIFERFSSIIRLQRVIAYCMRFFTNASQQTKITGPLSLDEIRKAHNLIIKCTQAQYFAKELTELKQKNHVSRSSKILALSPFIDRDGIIRVGGRLQKSKLSYGQKHPILLPKSSHITHLVVRNEHNNQLHAGILGTLNAIRQRYWLVDGKNTVRFIVRKCIRCFKIKPSDLPEYCMGNLPKSRVTENRPFQVVGIDYCGPFFIKEKRFRNTKKLKVYVAVFICFVTKAVHLELVCDLSTEAFMASLKRFFARRGYAQTIYTDNATNFVGAKRLLDDLQKLLDSETHKQTVIQQLSNKGIVWRFTPPRSPHFGGLWEAAVKSFKHHFYRTVGDALFTFEELNTYIIEIEAILNSRPLTPLSPDPNDLNALTPAHFLIGESLTSLPEHDLTDVPTNRLSVWQHIQRIKQHFWARWHKEYLNELNIRTKWRNNVPSSLKLGTLVLLKDENLPPLRWNLGRIIEIHPGDDGVIRVVTVRTNQGIYKRSVRNICPLPVDVDNPVTPPSNN